MRVPIFLLLFFLFQHSAAQDKQVCFTFDDLPIVTYNIKDPNFQKDLVDTLIESLKNSKIPAIGFVTESKLYDEAGDLNYQVDLLKKWITEGFELGNHSFSHFDYNSAPYEKFTKDILKGEKVTRKLLSEKKQPLKYFRHPFLHQGNTKERYDSLENFLAKHNYITAPVTIDNDDYIFALAYEKSLVNKDFETMRKIGREYVDYMEKKVLYFENQAEKLFGRNISQILLLHASYLNSVYVDSLACMFRKHNYEFISLDKALEDEAYKSEILRYGNWGISWIDRWALSQGKKGDFFSGDPETPEYIIKLSK